MIAPTRAAGVAAGVAVLLLPLIAVVVKFTGAGWLVLILAFALPVFVLCYALLVVVAILGFFSPRAAFVGAGAVGVRGVIASWTHAVAGVVAAFFLVDFADVEPAYSPFTILLGKPDDDALIGTSTGLSILFGLLWAGGFVWLVVEWIIALATRRRRLG